MSSSFFQYSMLTTLTSSFNEEQWVEQIRKTLDDELEDETEIPVTIFAVPKTLMATDPNSYIPQQVAIGPYHHFRTELYDMERHKIASAKRNQKQLMNTKIQDIVTHLMKFEVRIRSNYHKPLAYNFETLAWMMIVDGSFLLEFLQVCGVKEGKVLTRDPSRLASLIDLSKNKPVHNAILRDIILLENQIPLFVVRMLLEFRFSSLSLADEMLFSFLTELSKDLSPFKTEEGSRKIEIKECAHFLDFLYHYIVPKVEVVASEIIEIHEDEFEEGGGDEEGDSFAKPGHVRRLMDVIWRIMSKYGDGPIRKIKQLIFSKPIKVIFKLPWTILTKIPIIKLLKEPIENVFGTFHKDGGDKKDDDKQNGPNTNNYPPLLEEIKIPSVSELADAGVQFLPTNGGITSIHFDMKTRSFHIPIVELDVNSEVVLRNLVAYEACCASGPLVLARYTEMMNGIVDTDADAKFLCERGIIVNHLKTEKEVADLWNGMSKSIRLTKVSSLDKVIGDVNKFYNGRWKVKLGKFIKKYVFGSWKVLTFLAAIALLLLTTLQAFCQVYSCGRIVAIEGLEPAK